ncbi:MAG: alkaline phosphatase D family protein [Verrucomicrobia bacterium]|nr:alkaline phosphatase D family protein [Verrucomicrobiota bacterium]
MLKLKVGVFGVLFCGSALAGSFTSAWEQSPDRMWAGKDLWANRLQDWEVEDGRLVCSGGNFGLGGRTVHLLSGRMDQAAAFKASVQIERLVSSGNMSSQALAGMVFGAGEQLDVLGASLSQGKNGLGMGLVGGINGEGFLEIRDLEEGESLAVGKRSVYKKGAAPLEVKVTSKGKKWQLTLSSGKNHVTAIVPWSKLEGNVALLAHPGGKGKSNKKLKQAGLFSFSDWHVDGKALEDTGVGCEQIISAQHTVSRDILKMTAQLMPVAREKCLDPVVLETLEGNEWKKMAEEEVVIPGFTATFREASWDATKATPYRLTYRDRLKSGKEAICTYAGTIGKDPVEKEDVVVAAFTGNHNLTSWSMKNWTLSSVAYPHRDLYDRVMQHQPDLLFWSGDQVYEGGSPTPPDKSGKESSYYDYLYKWYLWCLSSRHMTKDIPCVVVPDDHDVFQGNIWGAGGKVSKTQDDGGYQMPADWVRMIERTQTSHLPDPFDPTPIGLGIGVYYTGMDYGRISFAILEDRKFKSGPRGTVRPMDYSDGRADHVTDPSIDTRSFDLPGLKLLGDRQLKFLNEWSADWAGADMKCVLTQSVFANMATHHGPGAMNREGFLVADFDSNGWPQSGRDRALREIRRGCAFTIGGDQHLASMVQHGIDEWNDAGWALTVPSIANFYPRGWYPESPGKNHVAGMPDYTGEYLESFKNKVTVWAVNNPDQRTGKEPASIHDKMPGYGIVHFNKKSREITMECWPRYADPTDDAQQYAGWPRTISMFDNDGRKPLAWLPTLQIAGLDNPVIQVIQEESGEILYTVRILGNRYQPKVFAQGKYTIKIGDPDSDRWKTVSTGTQESGKTLEINL